MLPAAPCFFSLMVTLLVALTLAAAPPPAPTAGPSGADTVTFRFAWPAGFTAPVEYRRVRARDGKPLGELALRSELHVTDRGDERVVRLSGWSGAPAAADPLVVASGRIAWVVGRDGAFRGVEGTEDALARLRALAKEVEAHSPGAGARLEKLAPAAITKDASETWVMLVQFWNGEQLDVGEQYESDSTVPVAVLPGEQVRIRARIEVTRRLPCPGTGRSCVEVTMRSEPDAQDVARVTRQLLGELGAVGGQAAAMLGEMSAAAEFVLVTEPATLVPYRLSKVRTTTVAPAAGAQGAPSAAVKQRDETTWTFSYPAP